MSHGWWVGNSPAGCSGNAGCVRLTLVAVVMSSLDLLGLDLVFHRLHEVAWIVGPDDVLLGCRDDLT